MLVGVRLVEFLPWLAPLRPALLLSVCGAAYLWHGSDRTVRAGLLRNRTFRLMMLYLAWACITIPTALWPGMAFETIRGLVVCAILVGAILLLPATAIEVRRATAAFVGAAAIYVTLLFSAGRTSFGNRLSVGLSLDSNDVAVIFAICLPLALGLARTATSGARLRWLVVSGMMMFGVVATGSRGGTLALVAGCLVLVMGLRGGGRLGYLGLMLAVGFAAWQWGPAEYRDRMTALVQGQQDYNQTEYTGRKQVWERGRGYWRANPVLGVGAGNFPMAEGDQLDTVGLTGKWSAAHNSYVQVFAELGTPGGLIFVGLLLTAVRAALPLWRHRRRGGALGHRPEFLAAIAAAMIGGYFLSHGYAFHMMTTVALVTLAGVADTRGAAEPAVAPGPTVSRRAGVQAPRRRMAVHPTARGSFGR